MLAGRQLELYTVHNLKKRASVEYDCISRKQDAELKEKGFKWNEMQRNSAELFSINMYKKCNTRHIQILNDRNRRLYVIYIYFAIFTKFNFMDHAGRMHHFPENILQVFKTEPYNNI